MGHERGLSFVPLDGKAPRSKGWQSRPRETVDEAVDWAESGNVGVRTGSASGVIVIDDDRGGEGLTELGLDDAATVTVHTSKGRHLYFRPPEGVVIGNSRGKLAPGVDVRGEGGQAVYPGSIHPETSEMYDWAPGLGPDEVDIAELPADVVQRLTADGRDSRTHVRDEDAVAELDALSDGDQFRLSRYAKTQIEERSERLRTMADGEGRNEEFFKLQATACEHFNAGLVDEEHLQMPREAYGSHADVPEKKVASTYDSAVRKTHGKGTDVGSLLEWMNREREPSLFPASSTPTVAGSCPTDCLPSVLRDLVSETAKSLQVDEALVAIPVIGLVAASTLGVVKVRILPEWSVHPTLWLVALAETGERKSAVAAVVERPLRSWIHAQAEKHEVAVRSLRDEREMIDLQIQTKKKEAAKLGSHATDREGPRSEIERLHREKLALENRMPRDRDFVFQDTTMEAMVPRAQRTCGRAYICDTEGGFFSYLTGSRYGNGSVPAADFILKGREGEPFVVDRKNSESGTTRIPAVFVSMTMMVQPGVFAQVRDSQALRNVGVIGRMCVVRVPSRVGSRKLSRQGIPGDVLRRYDEMVRALLDDLQGPEERRLELRLSPDAHEFLQKQVHDPVEREMADGGRYADHRDVANRFSAMVVQIAALFHLAEYGTGEPEIGLDSVRNAHRFGLWLLESTLAVLGDKSGDPVAEFAATRFRHVEGGRLVQKEVFPAFKKAYPHQASMGSHALWHRLRPLLGLVDAPTHGRAGYFVGWEMIPAPDGSAGEEVVE